MRTREKRAWMTRVAKLRVEEASREGGAIEGVFESHLQTEARSLAWAARWKLRRDKRVEPVVKMISQSDLTADCWSVQAWGLRACRACEIRGTDECGGKAILEKITSGTFPETGLPSKKEGLA